MLAASQMSTGFYQLPALLDQYVLEAVLGQGGMGIVYRARHSRMAQKLVAIKVLTGTVEEQASRVNRFRREISANGEFEHPHIVLATDSGEDNGQWFLVMELVDGCDLEKLATKHRLAVPDVMEMGRQIALGLQEIERKGYVHRDIKPSNLMLDCTGTVKILDLGLIAPLDRDQSRSQLTPTNAILGTIDYLAPEQAKHARSVDIKADIYSLGCTLYRLLEGRVPYEGNISEKLAGHAFAPFPALTRPDLPVEVVAFVAQMVRKNPTQRPTSIEVVAFLARHTRDANLARLLASPVESPAAKVAEQNLAPTPNHPQSQVMRQLVSQLPYQRNRRWLIAAVAFLVCTGLFLAFFPRGPVPNRPPVIEGMATELFDLDRLPANVRHDLLERAPFSRIWYPDDGEPQLSYNNQTRMLHVSTPRTAVLLFGKTSAANYTFSMELRQPRFVGGLRMILGFKELQPKPVSISPLAGYQFIETFQSRPVNGTSQNLLQRGLGYIGKDNTGDQYLKGDHISLGSPLPESNRLTHLTLEVKNSCVLRVLISEVNLQDMTKNVMAQVTDPEWTSGAIGIALQRNCGSFCNIHFRREE